MSTWGFFERYRRKYEAGDKNSLPAALWFCLANNEPPPDWLKDAYVRAARRVWSYEVSSWDDVFGKPLKKGKQRKAAHRRYMIGSAIRERVMDRTHRAAINGERSPDKIDKNLFEEVGKEFGIKGTLAAEIYYEHQRWWDNPDDDDYY
jgi:hypothetical protein